MGDREQEETRLTLEGLADIDAGRVVDHSLVQAWADTLNSDCPQPPPASKNGTELISKDIVSSSGMSITASERETNVFPATLPGHIEEIRALFLEYGNSLGFSLCFQSFDEEVKTLPGAYGPPDGQLLLAHCDNRAAGCIALRKLAPGICEMKRLYVRPDYRGLGFGRKLVERLIADARAIGYERMRLDTVKSAMKDAIALYRTLGFREIAPYSSIPIESALWLVLLL
jgi:ribosomal protein S18 acetylase RimI-like enzyme